MLYNAFQVPIPSKEPHGKANINRFLEANNMDYMIKDGRETSGERRSFWKIVKYDWEAGKK